MFIGYEYHNCLNNKQRSPKLEGIRDTAYPSYTSEGFNKKLFVLILFECQNSEPASRC